MTIERTSVINEYLYRAEPEPGIEFTEKVQAHTFSDENGPVPFIERVQSSKSSSGQKNKKITKRSISPFTIVTSLFVVAVIVVFYISNILSVNHLLREINSYQAQHQKLLSEQELLRVRINKLSSLDRIQQIASSQIGLQYPKEAPQVIRIDAERLTEVRNFVKKDINK